jgi:hypothetical protein
MLSAFLGRVGMKRRIELLHLVAAAFRTCHFVGFMLLQRQDHQRLLPAVQTFVVVHGHGVPPLDFCDDTSVLLRFALAPFRDGRRQSGEGNCESAGGHRDFYETMGEGRWTVDA